MATKCARQQGGKYFMPSGRLNWPDGAASRKSVKAVRRLTGLEQLILDQGDPTAKGYEDEVVDLITSLLRYEPEDRLTAQEALQHPFLRRRLPHFEATPTASGVAGPVVALPAAAAAVHVVAAAATGLAGAEAALGVAATSTPVVAAEAS